MTYESIKTQNPTQSLVKRKKNIFPNFIPSYIIADHLIDDLVQEILERVESPDRSRPINLEIIGSTWTGKTEFIENLTSAILEEYSLDSRFNVSKRYGIITVFLNTYTTITSLYQSILDLLDWRYTLQMKVGYLERLIGEAVKIRGCKLIIIDEFNQITKTGNIRHRQEILEALRNLPNYTKRPLVITGTPEIKFVIESEYQTNNRFIKVDFPRLNLTKRKLSVSYNKNQNNWKTETEIVLNIFKSLDDDVNERTILKSKTQQDPEIIEILIKQSNGKLGTLIETYKYAVRFALKESSLVLKYNHFVTAISYLEKNGIYMDLEDNYNVIVEESWLDDFLDRNKS